MSTLDNLNNQQEFIANFEENHQKTARLKQRQKAKDDFVKGLMMWRIWLALAWQDIRIRYRRSIIGPFG